MGRFGEKTRVARLGWFGHVRWKDDGYDCEKDADGTAARKEETGKV